MEKSPKKSDSSEKVVSTFGTKSASKSAYSSLKYEITEHDLEDHAVAKVVAKTLLGEVKRCENEMSELRDYKDRFHQASEERARLQERLSGLGESVTVRSLLFSFGGLLGGILFIPEVQSYDFGIAVLCLACFGLAVWNPSFLEAFRKKTNV